MKPSSTRRDFLTGQAMGQLLVQRLRGSEDRVCALLEFTRPAMGTSFSTFVPAERHGHRWSETAVQALDLVQHLEGRFSIFQPASELSRINREAADGPVPLSRDLFELLVLAADLSARTCGAFDLSVSPLTRLWGFLGGTPAIPTQEAVDQVRRRVGTNWLELREQDCSISFARAGMEINLHSIGKGYALDQCANLLKEAGASDFLLQGGQSSLLANGMRARDNQVPWVVELRHPLQAEKLLGSFTLRDRSLATSGSSRQYLVDESGRRWGHIVDPRTGWPPSDTLGVSVLAPSAAEADALATAFFVMTVDEVTRFCDQHPTVGAVLVREGEGDDTVVQPVGDLAEAWQPSSR